MELISLITTFGSVIIPPLFSLVKGIFGKGKTESPEETISNLATTKPDAVAPYVEALSKYLTSQTQFFNRDVAGIPSAWVVNLRACIRPISVIIAFVILFMQVFKFAQTPNPVVITCQVVIGNWIGTKIEIHQ